MITLASLYDYTLPELPGCEVNLLNLHLVDAARNFCDASQYWTAPLDSENSVAGQATYDLSPDESDCELVRVTKLTVNDILLFDTRYDPNLSDFGPKYFQPPFTVSADLLELTLIAAEVPTEGQTGGIQTEGVIRPAVNATRLPDFFANEWRDALCFRTMARLMVMGKKPWTDRALAAEYERQYQLKVAFAASRGSSGNQRAPLRTRNSPL